VTTLFYKIPSDITFKKGWRKSLFGVTPPPSAPPLKVRGGRGVMTLVRGDFKIIYETLIL
jgi:hypothetical protein